MRGMYGRLGQTDRTLSCEGRQVRERKSQAESVEEGCLKGWRWYGRRNLRELRNGRLSERERESKENGMIVSWGFG